MWVGSFILVFFNSPLVLLRTHPDLFLGKAMEALFIIWLRGQGWAKVLMCYYLYTKS